MSDMENWKSFPKTLQIKSIILHENYNIDNTENDIAIVTILDKFDFKNQQIRHIKTIGEHVEIKGNMFVYVL